MEKFVQIRHKPADISRCGYLVVACPPMKSNVNVSTIARTASCMGGDKVDFDRAY